jgi:hypothetical protein
MPPNREPPDKGGSSIKNWTPSEIFYQTNVNHHHVPEGSKKRKVSVTGSQKNNNHHEPAGFFNTKPVSIDPATSGEILKEVISGKYIRNKPVLKYSHIIPSHGHIFHSEPATEPLSHNRQLPGNQPATEPLSHNRQLPGNQPTISTVHAHDHQGATSHLIKL